jgi:hypothetical protein
LAVLPPGPVSAVSVPVLSRGPKALADTWPITHFWLAGAEHAAYDAAREDYHARLVIVSTPTIRHVAAAGRKRILLNRHQHSARRGLIVYGLAGTGKTTAITQLGKNYEQLARRRGEHEPGTLPVVYVTVPPAATPKMLASSSELPRVFRTGNLRLFHAASCPFRYSSRTSCGVRYPSVEWRRVRL